MTDSELYLAFSKDLINHLKPLFRVLRLFPALIRRKIISYIKPFLYRCKCHGFLQYHLACSNQSCMFTSFKDYMHCHYPYELVHFPNCKKTISCAWCKSPLCWDCGIYHLFAKKICIYCYTFNFHYHFQFRLPLSDNWLLL